MAKCLMTDEVLPERNTYFAGHECRHPNRFSCVEYSHYFIDGTNCSLLRKPINVKKILGLEK